MLTLWFTPMASSMAVHIALNEVGADFELKPVVLNAKTDAFLAVNPDGRVPTLVADGKVMTEVAAILYWIGRTWPDAGLLPDDVAGQAEAISWMSFVASSLHPARLMGEEHAIAMYQRAENKLGEGRWVLGDTYSVADIHLFRLYWRFGKALPARFPLLAAHHDRMLERAAVQKTIAAEAKFVG